MSNYTSRRQQLACMPYRLLAVLALIVSLFLVVPLPADADQPGRGLAQDFEIAYLQFIIDHHFSALRMTELAAGTLVNPPMPDVSPDDRIQPTPGYAPSEPKATLDEIKSLARSANCMQREEILQAQTFLRDFYGMEYQPSVPPENQQRIDILEQAAPGDDFNHNFLEVFSRHHYLATTRSSECIVAADVAHVDLEEYCRGIVNAQLMEIDDMRHLLCENYEICDYQPLEGLAGRHSDPEPTF
jgi:uncharacterized protein (DUF305 family)